MLISVDDIDAPGFEETSTFFIYLFTLSLFLTYTRPKYFAAVNQFYLRSRNELTVNT